MHADKIYKQKNQRKQRGKLRRFLRSTV